MASASSRFLAVPDADLTEVIRFDATTAPTIPKPDEMTWWDWAVFLLQTVTEIEHALMVQYLYAAYSLARTDFTGTAVPPDAATRTANWRTTITSVAKEEMAHLLTEQNLLHFIGGPLNLERQDFPFRSLLYPFPLELQPLTKTSLAKYVSAEMPADPPDPDIAEIVARATQGAGGIHINRVGILFDTLIDIFADNTKLTDTDLRPQTATDLQAGPDDWLAFGRLIVRKVATREEAVDALRLIGEQGEGATDPPPEAKPSHFDHFIRIYREFPETELVTQPTWIPTLSIPINPNTLPSADSDPALERSRITHPTTRLWAQLFNVRYRMLLVDLTHALLLPGPYQDDNTNPTPRGNLRDWAFLQMRGEAVSGLRGIGKILTGRPLKQIPDPDAPTNAGPPFELPYTLAISDDEHSRWRLHRALLDTSHDLLSRIRGAGESGQLLDELDSIDTAARTIVDARLAAT